MSINLNKGGRINLAKEVPALARAGIGLGWDVSQHSTTKFDLDASIFMLAANGKLPADEFFIFYNNLRSPDGAVRHKGDNRTGAGDGDDETIEVELEKVSPEVMELLFVASIHEADLRRQNFGQVKNAYIRLYDLENNREILKFDLDEDFSMETAVEFGRLYRKDGAWRFAAVGQGCIDGLQGLVDRYA